MSEADIRKYAQLMQELGLTGMEFKDQDGVFIRLERQGVPAAQVPVSPAAAQPQPAASADHSAGICSPMVGVFYAAPTEDSDPFVRVGDRVKRGDTLCIIEAMKLMNEITAEEDGEIIDICAANGSVVEYGQILFKLL